MNGSSAGFKAGLAGLLLSAAIGAFPPAMAQSASSNLQPNATGDSVAELQQRLTDLGYYSGEITGFYGSLTREAVSQFQRDTGLTVDGIVGSATDAALNSPTSSNSATPRSLVRLGDSGEQILELQRRLADLGYYSGSPSGSFDRPTEEAVSRFQQDNGLPVDGIVGSETEGALRQPVGQAIVQSSRQSSTGDVSNRTASVLRLGDNGAAVSALQVRLSDLGFYQAAVTGSYDAQTQAAVVAFQRSRGLTADGIAGAQVSSALELAPASQTSPTQDWRQIQQARTEAQQARSEAEKAKQEAEQARLEAEQSQLVLNQNLQEGRYSVAELQRHLQSSGYNPGQVTGILTSETRSAITDAQRRYGLSETDLSDSFP